MPLRGPQMSHCMSSQVAYSVWPPAIALAIGSPGCSTPKRCAVARAFASETGCDAAAGAEQPRGAVRAARRPPRARERDQAPRERARSGGSDQDRRRRGGPAGAAVGELEREGERIQRRALAPVVELRAGLRGRLGDHADEREQPERAGEQRRQRGGAGRVPVRLAHPVSPPGPRWRRCVARLGARRGGSARARACWCRAAAPRPR